MADDNVLAGLTGFAEGVRDVLVPYINYKNRAKVQDFYDGEQLRRRSAAEMQNYRAKVPFEKDMTSHRIETEAANRQFTQLYDYEGTPMGRTQDKIEVLPRPPRGFNSQDPNRLLSTQELVYYGAPAGTRFSDVSGQTPLEPKARELMRSLDTAEQVVDDFYKELERIAPGKQSVSGVAGQAGRKLLSKTPILGTAKEPEVAAFSKRRESMRAFLARSFQEVGNLNETEQNVALKAISDVPTSAKERAAAKKLLLDTFRVSRERLVSKSSNLVGGPRAVTPYSGGEDEMGTLRGLFGQDLEELP